MSHLEAVHGVVGHAHLSPLKVGDSGGPLPSAALGASERQPPPRAGRARAVAGRRLGPGAWGLERGRLGGPETPRCHRGETEARQVGVGVEFRARVCVRLCACVAARACAETGAPQDAPHPGPSSFLHTPHLRFRFLCPELCSELLLPSFALVPCPPPPPLPASGPGSPRPRVSALSICLIGDSQSWGLSASVPGPSFCSPPPRLSLPLAGWLLLLGAVSLSLPRTLLLPPRAPAQAL